MATTIPRIRERFKDQLLVRLRDGAKATGLSEAYLRTEIRLGRLAARRAGRAVLIPADELKRWAANLPPAA